MSQAEAIGVKVRYFGIFSQHAGTTHETLTLPPGTTLAGLTGQLCHRHGPAFTEALRADLDYRSAVVAVNTEVVPGDYQLQEGDEVVVSYPAGGG